MTSVTLRSAESRISRDRPVPLYVQLAEQIRMLITAGRLPPESRIPSERELSEKYGISRMTARQAINHLVHSGILFRRPGKGTFVARPKVIAPLSLLAGFRTKVRQMGMEPGAKILHFDVETITEKHPAISGFRVDEKVLHLYRLRLADGLPVALQRAYISYRLCATLLQHDLNQESVVNLIKTECHVTLAKSSERFEASLPSPEEARLLDISLKTPVLVNVGWVYTDNNLLVKFSRGVYRGDLFSFAIETTTDNMPGLDAVRYSLSI